MAATCPGQCCLTPTAWWPGPWRAPAEVLHPYTAAEIANFSRWYLADYPVVVRVMDGGGLLVLAFDKNRVARVGPVQPLYLPKPAGDAGGRRCGFCNQPAAGGRAVLVQPAPDGARRDPARRRGRAACAGPAGAPAPKPAILPPPMLRSTARRPSWPGGMPHGPNGSAASPTMSALRSRSSSAMPRRSRMTPALPAAARTQAGAIRAQAERLRTLMEDLNLTSKLEYSMQPLRLRYLDPAELAPRRCDRLSQRRPARRIYAGFFRRRPGRYDGGRPGAFSPRARKT